MLGRRARRQLGRVRRCLAVAVLLAATACSSGAPAPDLLGLSRADALRSADAADVDVTVTESEVANADAGVVIAQTPAPGEAVQQQVRVVVAAAPTFPVTGRVILVGTGSWFGTHAECVGEGPYGEIRAGSRVRVYDAGGEDLLATGAVEAGSLADERCVLPFTLDLPQGHESFLVTIGEEEQTLDGERLQDSGRMDLILD